MTDIVTPCHGTPLLILTRSDGPAYMKSDVPDEILCDVEGCYNSWSATGSANIWNEGED